MKRANRDKKYNKKHRESLEGKLRGKMDKKKWNEKVRWKVERLKRESREGK